MTMGDYMRVENNRVVKHNNSVYACFIVIFKDDLRHSLNEVEKIIYKITKLLNNRLVKNNYGCFNLV